MGVRQSMVVVEDHDRRHHGRGHHEHDAVEVGACGRDRAKPKLVSGCHRVDVLRSRIKFCLR